MCSPKELLSGFQVFYNTHTLSNPNTTAKTLMRSSQMVPSESWMSHNLEDSHQRARQVAATYTVSRILIFPTLFMKDKHAQQHSQLHQKLKIRFCILKCQFKFQIYLTFRQVVLIFQHLKLKWASPGGTYDPITKFQQPHSHVTTIQILCNHPAFTANLHYIITFTLSGG